MKRSKTIQLVLITATLASCSQGTQPQPVYSDDWVYATRYPYPYLGRENDSATLFHQILPVNAYNNWFYIGQLHQTNQPPLVLKGSVVRSSQFIMRGGFGGHGIVSS
jgi:hypothetical protein